MDAQAEDGRRFGDERLIELVERAALDQLPLAELARGIANGVTDYQDGKLSDDASLLLLEYNGRKGDGPAVGTAPGS